MAYVLEHKTIEVNLKFNLINKLSYILKNKSK